MSIEGITVSKGFAGDVVEIPLDNVGEQLSDCSVYKV